MFEFSAYTLHANSPDLSSEAVGRSIVQSGFRSSREASISLSMTWTIRILIRFVMHHGARDSFVSSCPMKDVGSRWQCDRTTTKSPTRTYLQACMHWPRVDRKASSMQYQDFGISQLGIIPNRVYVLISEMAVSWACLSSWIHM